MIDKPPQYYQLHETDPWGNTLVRSEWPLQIWRTEAGRYVVWFWTNKEEGLHCARKDRGAADAVFDDARSLLR